MITFVGKTWGLHLEKVTKVSPEENLSMIVDSVNYARAEGKRVIYDAEHFFDAWRDDPGYALECLRAAVAAGAENVTLCDTNGSSLPAQVAEATAAVVAELGDRVEVGIHTHNDAECGVANSLAAVEAGARMVQGTINGYGERCGNANLVSILPALQLKLGYECVPADRMRLLTETAHFVDELTNTTPDPDQPYVGRNAFAHKGGMHVAGVQADARTFEHLDPQLVGNSRDVLISELSGKGSVLSRAESAGHRPRRRRRQARVLERVKEREHRGYHYETANASFELLLRREAGDLPAAVPPRGLPGDRREERAGFVDTQATIKIWVDGNRHLHTAEGDGPVNALDKALRLAPQEHHPQLPQIELTNFKVRLIEGAHGTDAITRVLLDSTDHEREWGSIGVSENIIEASWEALVDSLEYAFQPRRPPEDTGAHPGGRGRPPHAGRRSTRMTRAIPLAQAGARRARGGAGARGAALGPAFAGTDAGALRARLRRLPRRRRRGRGLLGHGGASPRRSGARLGRGRRGRHLAVQLRRLGQLPALRGRDAGLLRRRPGHPQPRPGGRRGGDRRARPPGCCRSTSSATRRRSPQLEQVAAQGGLGLLEDACEALGARDSEGRLVGSRGNLATFAFYANKQLTTGEGGMLAVADPEVGRAPAQRAQPGPGAGHGLGRPRPARLQLPAHRGAGGARRRPARAPRRDARRTRASAAAMYTERLAALDYGAPAGEGTRPGWCCPCRRPRRGAAELVRLRRPPAGGGRPRRGARRPRPARDRGQGLHAEHPPDGLLPRAVRLSRGPVPGRRGRLGPPARAAVLRLDLERTRSTGSARRWPRRCAATGPDPGRVGIGSARGPSVPRVQLSSGGGAMYASVRKYSVDADRVEQLMHRVDERFADRLEGMPGFVAYQAIDAGVDRSGEGTVFTGRRSSPTRDGRAVRRDRAPSSSATSSPTWASSASSRQRER